MKKLISILAITTTLFAANINVEISGIQNHKGVLFIGVFNEATNFPKKEYVYKGVILEVNSNTVKYQFKNIPNAIYALSVFCDKNNNGVLDKNFLGIPTERYGFSNSARGTFGPPSFDEAKFELLDNATIKVEVK